MADPTIEDAEAVLEEAVQAYREVLGTLTTDPERLTGQVADQIHANAHIATQKFRWADRAIRFELVAALAVGATALLVAMGW